MSFCDNENIFAEEQNGFRTGRSCEDHIFTVTNILEDRLNDKKATFAAFIDLEKAFDWVNRDLVLSKLLQYGIDGKFYQAIKRILSNTKSRVLLSNQIATDWFPINNGVRQGDPLSPTLFSLYINDLVDHLKEKCPTLTVADFEINTLLYADDMVLLAESERNLQQLLDELDAWCKLWRVKVNETKSEIIHFRKPNHLITEIRFYLNGVQLKKVNAYKNI